MPYVSSIEQRGIEIGREQGLEQGLAEGIAAILAGRFGEVPANLKDSLASHRAERLKQLSLLAATVESLQAFQEALE